MIDDTCIIELHDIHVTPFTNESSTGCIIKILMPYCMIYRFQFKNCEGFKFIICFILAQVRFNS